MVKEAWDFLKSRQKMNLLIVIINLLVFFILELNGDTINSRYMLEHGAMYTPWVLDYGEYYRLFTCMFLHFGVQHLLYNMLLLVFMGDILEKKVGKVRYLLIYLGGGILGNLLSLAASLKTEDYAVSAGASGAIFAVVGALFFLVVILREPVKELNGRRLAIMALLTLSDGFTQSGIDNMAHLGGFLGGICICLLIWRKKKTPEI